MRAFIAGFSVASAVALGLYSWTAPRAVLPPVPAFVAPGNECELVAVTPDGVRVYRAFGPKMLFASIIVVGPDGHASIRQ